MENPSLGKIAWLYGRIGNTTFGGGDPMVAALQVELIERKKWISRDDFALAFSLARITPGTNVLAFCVGTGARVLGIAGAIFAVLAVTLPSAVLAILITRGFDSWRTNPLAMSAFAGTIAAVSGMMWASVWLLLRPYVKGVQPGLRALVIAGGSFLAAWRFHISPVSIIIVAALLGFLWAEPAKK